MIRNPAGSVFRAAAAAALLALSAAADEVPRVCPACDHEVAYDEAFCHNCGGDLSGVPVPGAPAESEPVTPAVGEGAIAEAVRADVAFARKPGRPPFAALAALRNAAALARLDPDAIPAAAREELFDRAEAFFASLSREVAPCPLCRGKGTLERKKPPKKPAAAKGSLEEIVMDAPAASRTYPCPLCGGHGKAPRVRDRRKLLDAMLLGLRDYRRAAENAGRPERGGLMVPAGWTGDPPVPPADCNACAGTGSVPCRACGGFGRVACTDASGHVPPAPVALKADRGMRIDDYQYSHDRAAAARAACPSCGGSWDAPGAVVCPACGGKGLSACSACGGSGHGR